MEIEKRRALQAWSDAWDKEIRNHDPAYVGRPSLLARWKADRLTLLACQLIPHVCPSPTGVLMTTFPDPHPAIERPEHTRDTSHIRDAGRATFPAGPVPGDARPSVEGMPPDSQRGNQPGAPGLPEKPTGPNTAPAAR